MDRATILIADDDIIMRRLLEHHLQQAGYHVMSAINGAEAIERGQAHPIDLVITDLYMPFFNGVEVCERLHEHDETRKVPVIMLSAPAERLRRQEVSATGVYAWITKPFNPCDLLTTVAGALGRQS